MGTPVSGTLKSSAGQAYARAKKEAFPSVETPILIRSIFMLIAAHEMAKHDRNTFDGVEIRKFLDEARATVEEQSTAEDQNILCEMALSPCAAEIFSYALSRAAGINVPEVRISQKQPPKELGENEWIIKRTFAGYISSKRIWGALPVYFLPKDVHLPPEIEEQESAARGWILKNYRLNGWLEDFGVPTSFPLYQIERMINKACPLSRCFYEDFTATDESRLKVLAAAAWDSFPRCAIMAWRHLVWSTYPHNSNLLVTRDGTLYSIDHEKLIVADSPNDIERLATFVRHSEKLMRSCQRTTRITEADVITALKKVPAWAWSPDYALHTVDDAADYFIDRLRTWKKTFPPPSA